MGIRAGEGRFLTGGRLAVILAPATVVFVALMALLFGQDDGAEPAVTGGLSPTAATSSQAQTTGPTEAASVETTTADPAEPSMTQAEFNYVNAASSTSGAETPYDILQEGLDYCRQIADYSGDALVAYLIEDDVLRDEPAIRYLCPSGAKALAAAKLGFSDGNYAVVKKVTDPLRQIRPGRYRTMPGARDCYWSRLTKGGSTIDNDFVDFASGGVRVTIRASDGGFKSDGCTAWLRQ